VYKMWILYPPVSVILLVHLSIKIDPSVVREKSQLAIKLDVTKRLIVPITEHESDG
jgi:hypothetical protein